MSKSQLEVPRSTYIHIPFCRHRCGYCNFTVIASRDDLIPQLLDALEREMAETLGIPHEMDTIFVGGGTPSHLEISQLQRLNEMIDRWLPRKSSSAEAEYSCELNPIDCTDEKLTVLKSAGINRVSLGGQSFSNRKLEALERDHDGEQLIRAIEKCRSYFDNVSLDLIFAAPNETAAEWEEDVRIALAQPIQHLSTYGMTIEKGSAFFGRLRRNQLNEIESDLQLEMYRHVIESALADGWEHYEVSNFARPGYRCRHNEAYWKSQPWFGIGPGAASFVQQEPGRWVRRVNQRSTTGYLQKLDRGHSPVAESDVVDLEQYVRERLVFGMRRLEGINLDELSEFWGRSVWPLFIPYLDDYVTRGWMELVSESSSGDSRLRLTREGLFISDGLWPPLLCDAES